MRGRSWWFREGKNCAMSNARVLVVRFLAHPGQMIWVSTTSASIVDLNFKPSSWLEWIKLLDIVWNWRCSPIIFLTSFPIVLRRTNGQYDLGESNVVLLDLGMTTVVEVLKWVSQCPSSMQVLVMLMNLPIQSSSLIIDLIWLHVSLSGPGANELLHFSIALIILFLENDFHSIVGLSGISSRKWVSTSLSWAELKDLWRAFYRSSNSMYGYSLYWIALITGSLRFLTQFISSYGLHFLFVISSIFLLKNEYLDFLTILLKFFQFSRLRSCRYFCSICQQSLF